MKNPNSLSGKTLLIAEDEADLREPLAMEFSSLGCKVFEACNGVEGFKIVSTEAIDVVVSDIRMPGGDGIEMLKKIKALDQQLPVVMFITGFSDVSREEAYDLGAEAILTKPFDLDEIEETVERLVEPIESRWAAAAAANVVRQRVERTYQTLEAAMKEGSFALGRGGFFMNKADQPLMPTRGGNVSFAITFAQGDVFVIEGTGVTRWIRTQDLQDGHPGFGIEFESLSESSRQQVLALTGGTRSYLPRGLFVPQS